MNTRHPAWVVLLLLTGNSGDAHAQVADQCAMGDAACYERRYFDACASRTVATPMTCAALVRSIESSPTRSGRLARFALAQAHVALSRHMGSGDTEEMARQRAAALAVYRQLAADDPSDPEALLGIATVTDDPRERMDLRRQVISLNGSPIVVRTLTDELSRSERPEDLIEAAEINERLYDSALPLGRLTLVDLIVGLYTRAGAEDRAGAFRQRARRDSDVDERLGELSQLRITNPGRTRVLLEELCHPTMIGAVSVEPCLRGIDLASQATAQAGDSAQVRDIAAAAANMMGSLVMLSRAALPSADPDWQARFAGRLDDFIARGQVSGVVFQARAWIETEQLRKVEILERGVRIAPDHYWLLHDLSGEYMALRRWDDALELLRRAGDLPDILSGQRQTIERNIQLVEEARERARP